METSYTLSCLKPFKSVILFLFLLFIFSKTHLCHATVSQNKTLSEINFYNFTKGYYNIVKYSENDDSNFRTIYETELPYINITFNAPSDGYLDIYLTPLDGPVPYINLDQKWEIKSLTYSKNMFKNETTYFLITPPLIFIDYNSSRHIGGGLTLWEMYTWPNLSGNINYTFTSFDEISFELIMHPSKPVQGEKVSLFTKSNVKICNLTWSVSWSNVNWINVTEVLEIENIDSGDYSILVVGYDEFNNSHKDEVDFIVNPKRMLEQSQAELSLFSVEYPYTVNVGDSIPLIATIDYHLSNVTEIKLITQDASSGEYINDERYVLEGNGSIQLSTTILAKESGSIDLKLKFYYNKEKTWVLLDESSMMITINVLDNDESKTVPSFDLLSLLLGFIIFSFIISKRNKINRQNRIILSS
jgi:hypothetical protein